MRLNPDDKEKLRVLELDGDYPVVSQAVLYSATFVDASDGEEKLLADCKLPVVDTMVELSEGFYIDGVLVDKSVELPASWTQDTEPDQETII